MWNEVKRFSAIFRLNRYLRKNRSKTTSNHVFRPLSCTNRTLDGPSRSEAKWHRVTASCVRTKRPVLIGPPIIFLI